jgi:uncharacterized protein YpmS
MKKKKTRIKLYIWLSIPLVLIFLAFILIIHKPNQYTPLRIADQNQISTYLTHYLMPVIYNNSQLDEPFEVVITEEGLNDIIARWRQPMNYNNITITEPQAVLTQKQIILIAAAKTRFANTVLTVRITPAIDSSGKLNIHVDSVSLGAAPITSLAKSTARKAFSDWLSFTGTESDNITAQICTSLLDDEPFDPVFMFSEKYLRITKIKLEKKKITIMLLPLSDISHPPYKN